MTTLTIYNAETGQLLQRITSNNPEILELNVGNQQYVEGLFDPFSQYVDVTNKEIKSLPENPSTSLLVYQFDWTSKQWVINTEQTAISVRARRDSLLKVIDAISPVRYNTFTQEQKDQVTTYRQALLDVPQQSGFPESINWPDKPSWI